MYVYVCVLYCKTTTRETIGKRLPREIVRVSILGRQIGSSNCFLNIYIDLLEVSS